MWQGLSGPRNETPHTCLDHEVSLTTGNLWLARLAIHSDEIAGGTAEKVVIARLSCAFSASHQFVRQHNLMGWFNAVLFKRLAGAGDHSLAWESAQERVD